ncbi:MAG: DUF1349 domain-containing protein [Akkermansiaceae bacterium]|nr:DUF1349 domain-containing protein [Akkermansiaceae bacterium]
MRIICILSLVSVVPLQADKTLFHDDFRGNLAAGWKWVREDPKAWRSTEEGLEIRVLPGNMWGPPNNARNVLVRSVPDPSRGPLEVTVKVHNQPTEQYEQVDLVWYYDDSNMVKIGLEQVDRELCVVMGREEKDRTRTIAIVRKATPSLDLRFSVRGDRIEGHYRLDGAADWAKAGECTLPVHGKPKVSLQAYQGPAEVERWARITEFRIRKIAPEE